MVPAIPVVETTGYIPMPLRGTRLEVFYLELNRSKKIFKPRAQGIVPGAAIFQ